MFRKLFSKKPATPKPFVGFRRGRGQWGFAFHIIKDEEWVSICGINVVERKSEVTPESVLASLPSDHPGFYHCSKCVEEFTGKKPNS